MEQFKTNFSRYLATAKEVAIVALQCIGILALFMLGMACFNMQGGYPPFFWM